MRKLSFSSFLRIVPLTTALLFATVATCFFLARYAGLDGGGSNQASRVLHLALPACVLVIEFIVLWKLDQEMKERKAQQAEMQKTQSALQQFQAAIGRVNYMASIASLIQRAKREVLFTSASMESSKRSREQQEIYDAVSRRQKQDELDGNHRYSHRGIIAQRPGALAGTLELMSKTNVKCRISHVLCMTRLRFVIGDRDEAILGIALGEPGLMEGADSLGEQKTDLSFKVSSTMLASALADRFEVLWAKASEPSDYLAELIAASKESKPGYSRKDVRRWLRADELAIGDDWLASYCEAYRALPSGSVDARMHNAAESAQQSSHNDGNRDSPADKQSPTHESDVPRQIDSISQRPEKPAQPPTPPDEQPRPRKRKPGDTKSQ